MKVYELIAELNKYEQIKIKNCKTNLKLNLTFKEI